ncbi:collagen alpha-3(IX) chain-like [Equus caballus]|uniref:collagen alpha-3(IX) chain-like n=1 Tax=Equus caballus TaxID=9796 RepID=UPI0038B3EA39
MPGIGGLWSKGAVFQVLAGARAAGEGGSRACGQGCGGQSGGRRPSRFLSDWSQRFLSAASYLQPALGQLRGQAPLQSHPPLESPLGRRPPRPWGQRLLGRSCWFPAPARGNGSLRRQTGLSPTRHHLVRKVGPSPLRHQQARGPVLACSAEGGSRRQTPRGLPSSSPPSPADPLGFRCSLLPALPRCLGLRGRSHQAGPQPPPGAGGKAASGWTAHGGHQGLLERLPCSQVAGLTGRGSPASEGAASVKGQPLCRWGPAENRATPRDGEGWSSCPARNSHLGDSEFCLELRPCEPGVLLHRQHPVRAAERPVRERRPGRRSRTLSRLEEADSCKGQSRRPHGPPPPPQSRGGQKPQERGLRGPVSPLRTLTVLWAVAHKSASAPAAAAVPS